MADALAMRANGFAGLAAVLAVLGLGLAASPASAGAGSGAAAGRALSGGAAFDTSVPPPARRPVVSQLTVSPRAVVAGTALPRLRLRVRQRGIEQVQARIVVVRLPHDVPVARIALGWVKTGSLATASWPTGIALRAGRYAIGVHAKDSRGHNLRRTARSPGRTRIVVHAAPAAQPIAAQPSAALPAPAPSPGGRGVFPVAGPFTFGDGDGRFGAGRPGHLHEGQDIVAAAGEPVVAPYAGTVSSTSYQASGAGEYVVLDAVDGRDYFFAHCTRHSTVVAPGEVVAAGAPLCRVGSTGDATGPHLHFEIWVVGWRVAGGYPIDPLPELRAWAQA
ncbi:MAG TPA: M23 family metallopeptidase [Solirubrobacteraceae bacterium]|jgi:biotin carboxyl carrier protein